MKMVSRFFPLAFLTLALTQCSWFSADDEQPVKLTAQQMYAKAEYELDEGSYSDAIDDLENYLTHYPNAQKAESAQVRLVYANLQQENYDAALAEADRYARQYPRGKHADYVLYLKGTTYFAMSGDMIEKWLGADAAMRDQVYLTDAQKTFMRLVKSYPHGEYAELSMNQLIRLHRMLAAREVALAEFYKDKDAYVACTHHAMVVIDDYEDTDQADKAYHLAADCYEALKLGDIAAKLEKRHQAYLKAHKSQTPFPAHED